MFTVLLPGTTLIKPVTIHDAQQDVKNKDEIIHQ
jgi:hypothetical protein